MTKYPRVMRAMMEIPWAILPAKLTDIEGFLLRLQTDGPLTAAAVQEQFGMKDARPRIRVGSVEVIPVQGVISQKINMVDNISGPGGTSTEMLGQQIQRAAEDKTVASILLDIDSPGGSVSGVPELADIITAAREKKRVVAMVSPVAASAAYWLASAAHEIVVTPSGAVGSIGVFMMHQDVSKAAEAEGVKTTYVKAGKYKTEGNPFEPLSEEARAAIQDQVNSYYDMFVKAVARGRGATQQAVRGGFGEGRMVLAADAVKLGMADRVGTFDATVGRLLLRGARQAGDKTAITTIRDFEAFLRDEGGFSNAVAKRMAATGFEDGASEPRDGADAPHAHQDGLDQETQTALRAFIAESGQ